MLSKELTNKQLEAAKKILKNKLGYYKKFESDFNEQIKTSHIGYAYLELGKQVLNTFEGGLLKEYISYTELSDLIEENHIITSMFLVALGSAFAEVGTSQAQKWNY